MILGSGGVRALVRCPARFRGTAEWSRCGAELTALMLLAAHACLASSHAAPFRQHNDCTLR
jgi:hypothetical protein